MSGYKPQSGPPGTGPAHVGSRNNRTLRRQQKAMTWRPAALPQLPTKSSDLQRFADSIAPNLNLPDVDSIAISASSKMGKQAKAWKSGYRRRLITANLDLSSDNIETITSAVWSAYAPIFLEKCKAAKADVLEQRFTKRFTLSNPHFESQRAERRTQLCDEVRANNPTMAWEDCMERAIILEKGEIIRAGQEDKRKEKEENRARRAAKLARRSRPKAGQMKKQLGPFVEAGQQSIKNYFAKTEEPLMMRGEPADVADAHLWVVDVTGSVPQRPLPPLALSSQAGPSLSGARLQERAAAVKAPQNKTQLNPAWEVDLAESAHQLSLQPLVLRRKHEPSQPEYEPDDYEPSEYEPPEYINNVKSPPKEIQIPRATIAAERANARGRVMTRSMRSAQGLPHTNGQAKESAYIVARREQLRQEEVQRAAREAEYIETRRKEIEEANSRQAENRRAKAHQESIRREEARRESARQNAARQEQAKKEKEVRDEMLYRAVVKTQNIQRWMNSMVEEEPEAVPEDVLDGLDGDGDAEMDDLQMLRSASQERMADANDDMEL